MFDDKFVYVSIVCFDVVLLLFYLSMKCTHSWFYKSRSKTPFLQ